MSQNSRDDTPLRYRKLKADGTVGTAEQTIEEMLGLPPGSVRIMNPSGRDARSDKQIGTLRKHWDEHYRQLSESLKETAPKRTLDNKARELEESPANGKWSTQLTERTKQSLEHIELANFSLGYAPVKNVDGRDGIIDLRDAMTRTWVVRDKPGDSERQWRYGSIDALINAGWVIE